MEIAITCTTLGSDTRVFDISTTVLRIRTFFWERFHQHGLSGTSRCYFPIRWEIPLRGRGLRSPLWFHLPPVRQMKAGFSRLSEILSRWTKVWPWKRSQPDWVNKWEKDGSKPEKLTSVGAWCWISRNNETKKDETEGSRNLRVDSLPLKVSRLILLAEGDPLTRWRILLGGLMITLS